MTNKPTRFDKHSRKILFAIWILVLLGGAAALELSLTPGAARYAGSGQSSGPGPARFLVMREWKRNTDYRFSPPTERTLYPGTGLQEVYQISTDSDGFIEPARRHSQPDISIVFLGGSTTECMFVASENRFPYLTAKILEQTLGLKINGINAAHSGNNSFHSLLLLIGKIIPLKPDFVILMNTVNDIGVLSTNGTYWVKSDTLRILQEERISSTEAGRILIRSLIPYTSQVFQQASKSIRRIIQTSPAQAQTSTTTDSANERTATMGRNFESSLKSFVRIAIAWNITPILMTEAYVPPTSIEEHQATFVRPERLAKAGLQPETFPNIHDYFNAIVREVAQSEGVPLIDLADAHNLSSGDVYDSIHFTDQGSKKVAEIIADVLKKQITVRKKAHNEPTKSP